MGSGFLPARSAAPQTRESGDLIQISAANAKFRALDIYSVKVSRGFVESCRFHNRTHLHMLVVQMDSKSWCEFRIVLMQASARGRVGFIRRYLQQDAYFWLLLRFSCLRRSCSSADFFTIRFPRLSENAKFQLYFSLFRLWLSFLCTMETDDAGVCRSDSLWSVVLLCCSEPYYESCVRVIRSAKLEDPRTTGPQLRCTSKAPHPRRHFRPAGTSWHTCSCILWSNMCTATLVALGARAKPSSTNAFSMLCRGSQPAKGKQVNTPSRDFAGATCLPKPVKPKPQTLNPKP